MLIPYPICKGRKFKREKLKKLIRPISCKKKSIISNYNLSEKNKIRFITQLFRWFRKDSKYYKINFFLEKKIYNIKLRYYKPISKNTKSRLKKITIKIKLLYKRL